MSLKGLRGRMAVGALGFALTMGPATLGLADDVDVTVSTNNGLNLDAFAGATARIFPGVTVANTGTLMPGGTFSGVAAATQAWTLTNQGIVDAQIGNAVTLSAGGTVDNQGRIDSGFNGIRIQNGGIVINAAGGVIETGASAVHVSGGGSLDNAGRIVGEGGATAVLFDGGGTVTNRAGALIEGNGAGNGLSIRGGAVRSLTNNGTIIDVSGGFAAGAVIQGGTVTTNNTGVITGSYNAIWAITGAPTAIVNAGQLTATTAGAIELQHGGTVRNSGTIQGALGIEVLPGFMVADASTAVANSGTITGTGGTAIRFATGTNSLTLQTGNVLGGNVVGGPGADSLVLEGTGTESIAKFSNFETLTMQGANWALTGNGAFATSGAVQSGLLRVNGQLTTPALTVQNGGALGGGGTVIANVTNNGNIAPGNSIGTLTVTGNYTQATGSTYTAEVDTTPASDLIAVSGTATIQNGTTVNVLAAPGVYTLGQRYTILTAAGGVTGAYTTLTDNAPFVDFALDYDLNNVFLDVTRSAVAFAAIAQTPNQRASASGTEALGVGNPVFDAVLMLDATGARNAFDQLSGEIHASILGTLMTDSHLLRDLILGRLQFGGGAGAVFAPPIPVLNYAGDDLHAAFAAAPAPLEERVIAAWAQAIGNWGSADGDGNAASLHRRTGGVLGGIDATFGKHWRVGAAGGYQRTSLDVDDRNSSASIDTYQVAAYAGTRQGPFSVNLGASFGWHDIDTSRDIAFLGFTDTANATYDGYTAQAFGEIGYSFNLGPIALQPFAGLAHVRVKTDAFTENGGPASLTGGDDSIDTTFSTIGLRLAAPLPVPGLTGAVAKATLAWRHAFDAAAPTAQLAFASQPATPFTVAGVAIAENAAVIELGLDGTIGKDTMLGIAYSGQIASSAQDHAIRGSLTWRF